MLRFLVFLVLLLAFPGWGGAQSGKPARLTIDDIQALPDTTFGVVFHFVALPDGRNYVADARDSLLATHGNNEVLRADVLMWYLIREVNKRFRTGVIDYPPSKDTKLRFVYANGPDPLASAYFYAHGERLRPVAGAFNVILVDHPGTTNASTRGKGSRTIYLYNTLPDYLRGSNNTWDPARTLAHEIGHALSLDHTFKCDNPCAGRGFDPYEECFGECVNHNSGSGEVSCFGGSDRELLMGYGSQLFLTPCEVEQIWDHLRTAK
ncbi:M43 family zinc metalloprotease [Lewinella sp. IMCC34183]|uniref:M43 family zinc metalloprotease n=1 Tax=Lewinella sp. IMCC34183 TaxID=2248762 RepID=UPI000E27522A|nr:M43 family zinc metalloprotease [Lewinella sp. IMCC34183]